MLYGQEWTKDEEGSSSIFLHFVFGLPPQQGWEVGYVCARDRKPRTQAAERNHYALRPQKRSFNVGKYLIEYSTTIGTESETEGQTPFFLPSPQTPLTPIANPRCLAEHPLNGNTPSLLCKHGNREAGKLAPVTLQRGECFIIHNSSFRSPTFSLVCYITLKSTNVRLLSLGFSPRTLLSLVQTLSCDSGIKRAIGEN